jgi:hypothetical protein
VRRDTCLARGGGEDGDLVVEDVSEFLGCRVGRIDSESRPPLDDGIFL